MSALLILTRRIRNEANQLLLRNTTCVYLKGALTQLYAYFV